MSDSIIDRIERYGYAYEDRYHVCPRCGDECRRFFVQDGEVLVNGEICTQRGKKLRPGDRVMLSDQGYYVTGA